MRTVSKHRCPRCGSRLEHDSACHALADLARVLKCPRESCATSWLPGERGRLVKYDLGADVSGLLDAGCGV